MEKSGYLTRPKLRAAYDRICESAWLHDTRAAEAFLRTIWRYSVYRGISFDDAAERLGY